MVILLKQPKLAETRCKQITGFHEHRCDVEFNFIPLESGWCLVHTKDVKKTCRMSE